MHLFYTLIGYILLEITLPHYFGGEMQNTKSLYVRLDGSEKGSHLASFVFSYLIFFKEKK